MSIAVNILVVEDSEDDTLLLLRALERSDFDPDYVRVESADDLSLQLGMRDWDIVITDYSLPGFSGIDAIRIVRQNDPDIPCIMVSGKAGEEIAVEAMRAGASDYILKENFRRLAPAVLRELDEHVVRKEKRKIERQLIETNENIEAFFTIAHDDFVLIISPDGTIINANGVVASALGVDRARLQGASLYSSNSVLSIEKKMFMIDEIMKEKKACTFVMENDGRYLDCSLYPVIRSGEVVRIIALARDITLRRRMEEALRESELRLRMTLDAVEEGLWDWDITTGSSYYSPRFFMMFGYEPNEFPSTFQTWRDFVYPDDLPRFDQYLEEYTIEGKGQFSIEFRIITKAGETRWIQSRGRIVAWDAGGKPSRMVGTHTDVTQRKEIENQILRERQKMMNILGSMNDGVNIISSNYQVEYINAAMYEEFGSPEGKSCFEFFNNRNDPCSWCRNDDVFSGKSVQYEWYCGQKDKYYDLFATPIFNSDGTVSKLEIFHDITKLKQAESVIRASLAEKDTLLKEIHHRVKNNLQIISSLLNLQERFVRDPADIDIFRNSRSRVKSMALIHEMLYQSKNIARINFGEYVEKLVSHLVQGHFSSHSGIRVRIEVADIHLDVDTAIPCGLIINELLTNAFKYAFPDGRSGEVLVTMSRMDNLCRLCVSDNGIGFPEDLDVTSDNTLGMNLVFSLSRQLGGTITIGNSGGGSVTVEFPS